nr:hypothetical protein [Tanacetum cinerariifolium]
MESTRRNVPVESTNSLALVSYDGLGGYDWSDQVKEGPNYALMEYSTSSSDSEAGLKSVEERLEFFKTNESIYSKDINKLKFKIQCNEITIIELRKKLETVQREKDSIQLTVEKLKNASKSLNKLIDSQIVGNYKKGLGYNAVLPPHTGLFIPPKPDLSYISLEEFTSEPAVETLNAKTSEKLPEVVKKDNGAPIIKDWQSDDKDEIVPQPKIEKKIVQASVAKVEFVKPKQQSQNARKTVKDVEKSRQSTNFKRGNQRNWNYMMSQRLGSNFKMYKPIMSVVVLIICKKSEIAI